MVRLRNQLALHPLFVEDRRQRPSLPIAEIARHVFQPHRRTGPCNVRLQALWPVQWGFGLPLNQKILKKASDAANINNCRASKPRIQHTSSVMSMME